MRRLIAIAGALLLIGSGSAFGLTWDFETAAQGAQWASPQGKWGVAGGVLAVTSKDLPAQRSFAGDASWKDYTIETKLRVNDGNWAGVIFRAKSDFEYYVAYVNVPDNKTELWRHKADKHDSRDAVNSNNAAKDTKVGRGAWMDVKIDVKGDTFTFVLNGKDQWTHKDALYTAGKVGAFTWQTTASWDNFKVTGPGIDSTTPVEPKSKLAATWGLLKTE